MFVFTQCSIPPEIPIWRVDQCRRMIANRFASLIHNVGTVPVLLPCQLNGSGFIYWRIADNALHNITRHTGDLRPKLGLPFAMKCTVNSRFRAIVLRTILEDGGKMPRFLDRRTPQLIFRGDLAR